MLKGSLAQGQKKGDRNEACNESVQNRYDYSAVLASLELEEVNIVAAPTKYAGITLLNLDESAVSTLSSIRNIEALILDEEAATKLKQSSTANEMLSFKSLDGVDEREQYEHPSQLLHIQKATRNKR